jgi:TRAP-type C4-dicarboxylate transport system permease small subunit
MPKLFNAFDRVRPVYDAVYKAVLVICKLLLVADILITSYAVFGRLVGGIQLADGRYLRNVVFFINDPAWSEEIVLTLMSYMAVLSAALAIRTNAHIRMTALDRYLPEKVIMVLDVLADLAVMTLGVIMLVVGLKYATTLGSRGYYVSLPKLSKFWQYLPIPVAGFAMIVFEIESLINNLKKFFVKEEV